MATRKKQAAEASLPAFYLATADLYLGADDSGSMPVAAFREGDRVPPAMVEPNGWQDLVTDPSQPADEAPADEPEPDAAAEPAEATDMPAEAGKE